MSDFNLGTARGVIDITYRPGGVKAANKDLDTLAAKSAKNTKVLQGAGLAAGKAGLVMAVGIGVAVNAAANFEQRMSAVKAVSGASASEMATLSAKALQLGKDTSFSATEAASAIEELVKAGVSVPDVMNGAADATVALAAAGEIALPQAATIAANAMNAFGLSAKDLPKVADTIAGAANASAIDVGEFAQSLSQSGAVANLAGVTFDELAVAIAEMGNAGIKGSDAGTSLKTFLSNLQPQTKKQIALFDELGITTDGMSNKFYDAEGNFAGMANAQQVLQDSLKGMSKQQKQAALETLFGSDAIRAAAILAENGSKGYDTLAKSMGKVTAAEVAATRMDNFKGSLEELKGSLETAGIMMGQVLLPAIRKLVDGFTSLLGKFLSLSPESQALIIKIIGIAAAVLLALGAMVKIQKGIQAVTGVFSALNSVLGKNPFIIIIAALIALGVGLYTLYKKSAKFRSIIDGVFRGIAKVFNSVKDFLAPVIGYFVEVWEGIKDVFSGEGWGRLGKIILKGLQHIGSLFGQLFGFIGGALGDFGAKLWGWIKDGFSFVVTNIPVALKWVATQVGKLPGLLLVALGTLAVGLFNLLKSAFVNLVPKIPGLLLTIVKAIAMLPLYIVGAALWLVKTGVQLLGGLVKGLVSALPAVLTFFGSILGWILARLGDVLGWLYDVGVSILTGLFNGLLLGIVAVLEFFGSIFGKIWAFFVDAASWLIEAGGAILRGLWDGIVAGAEAVWTFFKGIGAAIIGFFAAAGEWLVGVGKRIIEGLINGVKSMFSTLASLAKEAANILIAGVSNAVASQEGTLAAAVTGVMTGAGNAAADSARGVGLTIGTGMIDGMVGGIIGNASQAASAAANAVAEVNAAAKAAAGVNSPSTIWRDEIGRMLGAGLVVGLDRSKKESIAAARKLVTSTVYQLRKDLANISNNRFGTLKQVRSSMQKIIDELFKARERGIRVPNLLFAQMRQDQKVLEILAVQRATVTKKLTAAQKKLADLRKASAEQKAAVAETIRGSFSATSNGDILQNLEMSVVAANAFAKQIAALRKAGVNKNIIKEIGEAGLSGAGAADQLLSYSPAEIKKLNALYAKLGISANSVGAQVADSFYKAGIDSAVGNIRGLTSQQKAINAAATKLARLVTAQVKKALGIRSPSTVWRDQVGFQSGAGFAEGMLDSIRIVEKSASLLASRATLAAQAKSQAMTYLAGSGVLDGSIALSPASSTPAPIVVPPPDLTGLSFTGTLELADGSLVGIIDGRVDSKLEKTVRRMQGTRR